MTPGLTRTLSKVSQRSAQLWGRRSCLQAQHPLPWPMPHAPSAQGLPGMKVKAQRSHGDICPTRR